MNINTYDYLYNGYIDIKNNNDFDLYDKGFIINIDYNNFNFKFAKEDGSDIVFCRYSNGNDVLDTFVIYYDNVSEKSSFAIRVPYIKTNDVCRVYVFWGSDNIVTPGTDVFDFFYKFTTDQAAIDSGLWEIYRCNDSAVGLSVGYSGYARLLDEILKETKDWMVITGITSFREVITYTTRRFIIQFSGEANSLYIALYNNNDKAYGIEHDIRYSGTKTLYKNIEDLWLKDYYSYNIRIYYKEKTDRVYIDFDEYDNNGIFVRSSDTYSTERSVNGETKLSNFYYDSDYGPYGLNYTLIIKDYEYLDNCNIDISNLYTEYELVRPQNIDFSEYGDDITSMSFKHSSDVTSKAILLSNDYYGSIDNVFLTDSLDVVGCYAEIDFGVGSVDYINGSIRHFDNGHNGFYNAGKMSVDEGINDISFWSSTMEFPWAGVMFGDQKNVSYILLEPYDINSCVKDYTLYGTNKYPFFNNYLTTICSGTLSQSDVIQEIRFNNGGYYKSYRLSVDSTYGSSVKINRWRMYNSVVDSKKRVVSQIRLKPIDFSSLESTFPKRIKLEASDNLTDWVTLMDERNTYTPYYYNNYDGWQRYSFENDTPYWVYRLNMYDNWGDTDNRIGIAAWEMVEKKTEEITYRILGGDTNNIKAISFDPFSSNLYIANEVLNVVNDYKLKKTIEVDNIDDIVLI